MRCVLHLHKPLVELAALYALAHQQNHAAAFLLLTHLHAMPHQQEHADAQSLACICS